jgi:hypothetical protein
MRQHPSSAAVRHLRAQLAMLRRPSVWGAGLFLLLPLLFLADYWLNPQFLRFSRNRAPVDPLVETTSDPLGTVPAAPDNAALDQPVPAGSNAQLQDELMRLLLTAPDASLTPGSSSSASKANARSHQNTASAAPLTPVAVPITTAGSGGLWAMPVAATASETASNANSSDAPTAVSPLQSALDRAAGTTSTAPASSQPVAPASQPGLANGTAPSVTQLYNPGTVTSGALFQPSGQTYLPQTSPAPGTTGYTLPPALQTPANTPANRSFYPNRSNGSGHSSSSATLQPIPGTPAAPLQSLPVAPGYPAPTYVAPQSQVQPVQPAPFSVPRTPPGRQIGGGQINTFSNP